MRTPRIALYAAGASVILWAAKATAIGVAGGLDRTWLEEPLFLSGFLCHVLAVAALVLWWTRGRALAVRVIALLAAALVSAATAAGIGALVGAIAPADPGWVYGEVNLWVIAPVVLGLAWRAADAVGTRPRVGRSAVA